MFLVLMGLTIYFALGVVLTAVMYHQLAKRSQTRVVRFTAVTAVAIVLWAVPYGDHMLGKLEFNALCRNKSGLQVNRVVRDVEGFQGQALFASGDLLKEWGYKFSEVPLPNGLVIRYTLGENGEVSEERNVKATARYRISLTETNLDDQISRTEYSILDLTQDELLATYVTFGHSGGWFQRQLSAMHAYRNWCPKEQFSITAFMRNVLVPRKS
ncbi:MAG: hypothetical protein EPO27_01570 [Betaproteobacteria bacterium]|nr:MAG: hypothetical protein EPO27_01570 [Betaproteobacteria bacterium]